MMGNPTQVRRKLMGNLSRLFIGNPSDGFQSRWSIRMAKIERSPAEDSHFIYISDAHMDGYVPIHQKKDLLTLIKLASESLQMLEERDATT
jgi:hypothetical protein